ncbi:MAG: GNAT family N-acetyltransferase [Bacteroidota bacterium]
MILRKVTRDELNLLREISISTFIDAFGNQNTKENMAQYLSEKMSLEHMTSEYKNPESNFYFAIIDDRIVGYLKLNSGKAQSELIPEAIEVERIYVLKKHQSQGIGKEMFDAAISTARKRNMKTLWLGVWDQNTQAITFYERMGLKIFDTHSFMLGTDHQTDKLMKMNL